jgi:hypothetical protein
MAIGAGFVPGESRRRGVVGALVTRSTSERAMFCAAVEKLGVIRVRSLGKNGHG